MSRLSKDADEVPGVVGGGVNQEANGVVGLSVQPEVESIKCTEL